jgi:hypothetical protein
MKNIWTPLDLIRQLYNKFLWKYSAKRRAQETIREHLNLMVKGGQMHKIGARLRLRQMQGKLKHKAKTGG